MLLINSEISLNLIWSDNYVITDMPTRATLVVDPKMRALSDQIYPCSNRHKTLCTSGYSLNST